MAEYVHQPSSHKRKGATRAFAEIGGSKLAPKLHGYVFFSEVTNGTVVFVEIAGLPKYQPAHGDKAPIGPHGFHLHEKGSCAIGNPNDPFQAAGGHWNPDNQPHGHHAGDFPVLFSNDGHARMRFFTNRFKPDEIIGKAVIIHENPDDFRSQPSGDAGKRIGCGIIQPY